MNIFKQKGSQYWYVGFMVNKKAYVRSTKTTNKRVAEQIGEKIRNDVLLGSFNPENKKMITIGQAFEQYVATKAHQAHFSRLKYYWSWVAKNINLKDSVATLTTEQVERLVALRSVDGSQATVKHMANLLRGIHTYVTERGYKTTAIVWPSIEVKNARQRYLSAGEEKKLLEAMDPNRTWTNRGEGDLLEHQRRGMWKNYDMTIMLLDTGARLSEVLNLKWTEVDEKNGTINLFRSKTKTVSLLKMTKRLQEVMDRRAADKESDTYVFPGPDGKPSPRSAQVIRKAIKRAGIKDARLHDIRHTTASKLVNNGASLYEVSKVLGHSDIRTTSRYSHLEQKAVAEKMSGILDKLNK